MCSKKVKGEFFFFFFFFFFFSLPLYSGIEVWEGLSLGGKCNEPERLYFCLREVMERFVYLAIYSAQTLPSGGLGQMWGGHPSPGFMAANILTQHAPLRNRSTALAQQISFASRGDRTLGFCMQVGCANHSDNQLWLAWREYTDTALTHASPSWKCLRFHFNLCKYVMSVWDIFSWRTS